MIILILIPLLLAAPITNTTTIPSDEIVVPQEATDVVVEVVPDSPDRVDPIIPDGTPCVAGCPPDYDKTNPVTP